MTAEEIMQCLGSEHTAGLHHYQLTHVDEKYLDNIDKVIPKAVKARLMPIVEREFRWGDAPFGSLRLHRGAVPPPGSGQLGDGAAVSAAAATEYGEDTDLPTEDMEAGRATV